MVKAPSSSSLSQKSAYGDKFKSWRKGKGKKKKPGTGGGSLKHQLRGLERLLTKAADADRRSSIEQSIAEIKTKIEEKEQTEKERANAKKSHKSRFLDRQRLVRLWQQLQQNQKQQESNNKKQQQEKELYQLGLDMLYVAHFPHAQMSYQSLYTSNKERNMARGRALAKVVSARQTICKLFASKEIERVTWVPKQVYESLTMPSDWSTKLERETFDYPSKDEDEKHTSKKKQQIVSDDRFATTEGGASSKQQQEMLDAAQAIEVELDQLEKEEAVGKDGDDDLDDLAKDVAHAKQLLGESNKPSPKKSQPELSDSDDENNDSNDDSSSDGDEADPLTSSKRGTSKEEHTVKPTADGKDERNEGSSSSSSDDSDDDNSSDGKSPTQQSKTMQKFDDDSSCSSDSDSSSSSSDDDDDENDSESNNKRKSLWDADATVAKKTKASQEVASLLATLPPMEEPEEGNGFLVAADSNDASDDADVFANAKQHIPERATGDKSQGWATQRQRPGAQFNNNRQRGGGAAHRHPQDRWRR